MRRLIRIETLKYTNNTFILVVGLITLAVYALVSVSLQKIFSLFLSPVMEHTGSSFLRQFPYVWYYVPYVLSYFKIFPALLVIYMIGMEFSNRTSRQHIIDGLSRDEFVLAKTYMVILISLVFALAVMIMAGISGLAGGSAQGADAVPYLQFPLLYFYELLCYLLFVQALTFWLRRTLITVFALVIYGLIVEPLIGSQLPGGASSWLPLNAISGLVHDPSVNSTLFTIEPPLHRSAIDFVKPGLYAGLFLFLTFYRFRKINL